MLVLPPHDLVLCQVGHISDPRLTTGLDHHPADVRPQEAFVGIVWVEVGVGVAVVSTVTSCPPFDGTFDGTCASESEEVLEWLRGVV